MTIVLAENPEDVDLMTELCEKIADRIKKPVGYNWTPDLPKEKASANTIEVEFYLIPTNRKVMPQDTIARFCLSIMPGNSRYLVSHGQYVYEGYRRKGIGRLMTEYKEKLARSWDVEIMLAVVNDFNSPEVRIMDDLDWRGTTIVSRNARLMYKDLMED